MNEPASYARSELIGLRVVDASLGDLGPVVEVRTYPAADMLIVGERRLMVPMLLAYEMHVDVAGGRVSVNLPPGFDEL